MSPIRYTLLADGSSDGCLLPIINWVLENCGLDMARGPIGRFADRAKLKGATLHSGRASSGLETLIPAAIRVYPCDVLFVHRDAEKDTIESRQQEIQTAARGHTQYYVPIVPVRMTEAWLLTFEDALRCAAGNPNGKVTLSMPSPKSIEHLTDPKETLRSLLLDATELTGRHRKRAKRRFGLNRNQLVEAIDDFSPLRQLSAFLSFEQATAEALQQLRKDPS